MYNQKLDQNARRADVNEGADFVLLSRMSVLTLDALFCKLDLRFEASPSLEIMKLRRRKKTAE